MYGFNASRAIKKPRWISSSADRSLRLIFSWSGRDPGRCFLYDARANTLAA